MSYDDDAPDGFPGMFPMHLPNGLTPQKIMEEFKEFLKEKMEGEQYEALGPLSPKEVKEWNSIQALTFRAASMETEADSKRKLFWTKLERKLGIFDKNLKIEDHIVYIEKDSKKENSKQG